MPVGGGQRADAHAEPSRDRGPHLVLVQDFAFDLAGLEDILRERCQNGLGAQAEPQRFHAPDQAALPVADWRKMLSHKSKNNIRISCGK